MTALHLDTHVVVWLHEPRLDKLAPVLPILEGRELAVSPMVALELQYLHEIGRVSVPPEALLRALADTVGLTVASHPWGEVVRGALALGWTRDPFDRLIVAHALLAGAELITADAQLRSHCPSARWG